MHVVHPNPGHDGPIHSHHLLLSDGSIRPADCTVGNVHAVGTVAVRDFGGPGSVPELSVRQEVMHALAEVGFSHSVQSTAIMDCTLSGVLQVLYFYFDALVPVILHSNTCC